MKVLFVASGNSRTGISPIIKNQGESLIEQKIEIDYFPITGRGLINYLKHIPLLKEQLKDKQYDIIHAHYGLCGIIAHLARTKEMLVVSYMGGDLIGDTNSKGHYTLVGRFIVELNKYFSRKNDFNIVKSSQMLEQINSLSNAMVIPNGINLKFFVPIDKKTARHSLGLDSDKIFILFASNPKRPEKNFSLAKISVQSLNDNKIELKIAHDLSQENLVLIYNAADVLLLTSWFEGSPNVIKEAMACNLPIVATNVGDIVWLTNQVDGCYVTSFNSEEISESLKKAIHFSLLEGKTEARAKLIALGLSSEQISDKLRAVYTNLLSTS